MYNTFKNFYFFIKILNKKTIFFSLILLIILCGIIEALGILLLAPLVDTLSLSTNKSFISNLLNSISEYFKLNFFYFFIILFIATYSLKAILLTLLVYLQSKFIFNMQKDLSELILKNFANRPFFFYLKKNSSELLKIIVNDVNFLTHSGMTNWIILITELFVFTVIIIVLLIYNFFVASIILISVGFSSLLILYKTRKMLFKYGEDRTISDGKRMQAAQEILAGIRSIKLTQKLETFTSKYEKSNYIFSHAGRMHSFIQLTPRIWFEFIIVIILILVCIGYLFNGFSFLQIAPIFAIYVGAGFRILPSISRLVAANQSIRFTYNVAFDLKNYLNYDDSEYNDDKISKKDKYKNSYNGLEFKKYINFTNVTFKYPGSEKNIFNSINLSFKRGDLIGVSGPSGSGKTTFFDLLTGLIEPASGGIYSDNVNIKTNYKSWHSKIAYVEQSVFLIDASLAENIAFGEKKEVINLYNKHIEWLEPQDPLSRATQGFKSAVNYLQNTDNTKLIPEFVKRTDEMDRFRNEGFFAVFPELERLRSYE